MDIRDLDMDAIAARYEMTFARQNHDRPVLHIAYPTGGKVEHPAAPTSVRERWFNFDWRLDEFDCQLQEVGYLAEGFPTFWCNLGPDVLAGFTGSELDFSYEWTSWAKFRVEDWRNEAPLRFQREGWLWQTMEKFLRLAAERGAGRWLTGSGDLHSNGDGLSALRGPENLLMDLVDCPDEVQKRLAEMHEVFVQVLQAHFDIIHPLSGNMNSSWMAAACHGRFAVIQNDFCCMIGPAMFDEFFKAYVEKEAAALDYSIYHLDGPGAMCHTESICACPHLDLIQWVPGSRNKPLHEWPDLLRRIQQLGKGLWLYGNAAEAEAMMKYLKPEGCVYAVWCDSKEQAETLVKTATRIYGGGK